MMDSPGSARYRRKLSLESPRRRLSPQPLQRLSRPRKMSFPATNGGVSQHLNGSHLYSNGGVSQQMNGGGSHLYSNGISSAELSDAARRYRRFSNVSDAVSRKLSTTIGWRTVTIQEVVTQSKSMCGQHIRAWLKRRSLFNKRLGLQRLRSVANLPGNLAVCDVFVQLEALSLEMERRHPKLYSGVCRQMGLAVVTEKSIAKALSAMALEMFKVDITWFKIASFYNLVSGTAVDCVKQGHPEYLYGLVEAAGLVIERDVANWIANQGGWVGVLSKYRVPEDTSVFQMIALSVVGLIVFLVALAIVLKSIGNLVFFYQSS